MDKDSNRDKPRGPVLTKSYAEIVKVFTGNCNISETFNGSSEAQSMRYGISGEEVDQNRDNVTQKTTGGTVGETGNQTDSENSQIIAKSFCGQILKETCDRKETKDQASCLEQNNTEYINYGADGEIHNDEGGIEGHSKNNATDDSISELGCDLSESNHLKKDDIGLHNQEIHNDEGGIEGHNNTNATDDQLSGLDCDFSECNLREKDDVGQCKHDIIIAENNDDPGPHGSNRTEEEIYSKTPTQYFSAMSEKHESNDANSEDLNLFVKADSFNNITGVSDNSVDTVEGFMVSQDTGNNISDIYKDQHIDNSVNNEPQIAVSAQEKRDNHIAIHLSDFHSFPNAFVESQHEGIPSENEASSTGTSDCIDQYDTNSNSIQEMFRRDSLTDETSEETDNGSNIGRDESVVRECETHHEKQVSSGGDIDCTSDELCHTEEQFKNENSASEISEDLRDIRKQEAAEGKSSLTSYDPETRNMVCAIDFGTTYTGVAYGYSENPKWIKVPTLWSNRNYFPGFKTCTSVLTGKEGEFLAFGVEAEYLYSIKCSTGEYDNVELYRNFKMRLYKEKVITLVEPQ